MGFIKSIKKKMRLFFYQLVISKGIQEQDSPSIVIPLISQVLSEIEMFNSQVTRLTVILNAQPNVQSRILNNSQPEASLRISII